MRIGPRVLLMCALATTVCFSDSGGQPVPTLAFYITGDTGIDVLNTIIPELARENFAEAPPRAESTEHLPIAIFQRANGDEIQVIMAERCVVVAFYGADVLPGTDPGAFAHRFSNIHANLKKYLVGLPVPHPTILEGEIPGKRLCPGDWSHLQD